MSDLSLGESGDIARDQVRILRLAAMIVGMATTPLPVRCPRTEVDELVVTHVPEAAPCDLTDVLLWLSAEAESASR